MTVSSVVSKSAGLLDIVCASTTPLTFTRIVSLSGLPKSSAHRILSILMEERLVAFDPDRQTYEPGARLLGWSTRALNVNDLPSAASKFMDSLNEVTGAHVALSVLDGFRVLFVKTVDRIEPYRFAPRVGEHSLIHTTAAGKAMVAHLRPPRRRAIVDQLDLPRFTEHTITSRKKFAKELEIVRNRGIALSDREEFLPVSGIAAPVFGHHGDVVGAIGIWDRTERQSIDGLLRHEAELLAASRSLSARLGAPDAMPDAA